MLLADDTEEKGRGGERVKKKISLRVLEIKEKSLNCVKLSRGGERYTWLELCREAVLKMSTRKCAEMSLKRLGRGRKRGQVLWD